MSTPQSSRKKRSRDDNEEEEEEEEEQAVADNKDDTTTAAAAPPGVSPPGARLRSGRKARRQKPESEEKEAKKPKLTHEAQEEDGESEDEEMSDDNAKEETTSEDRIAMDEDSPDEEAKEANTEKQPPEEDSRPMARETPLPPRGSGTVRATKLRMLSEQTPGRPVAQTKMTAPAAAPATTSARLALSTQGTVPPPPARMNLKKTPRKNAQQASVDASPPPRHEGAAATTTTEEEVKPKESPAAAEDGTEPVILPLIEWEVPPWLDHSLSQPWVWFVILFLLMLPRLLIVHPFLDKAVYASRILVPGYKYVLGYPSTNVTLPTTTSPVPDDDTTAATRHLMETSQQWNETLRELENQKAVIMEELVQARRRLDERQGALQAQLEALDTQKEAVQGNLQTALAAWQGRLDQLERIEALSTQVLVPGSSAFDPEGFLALQESLGDAAETLLLSTWNLSLWDPPLETCDIPSLESTPSDDTDGKDTQQPLVITKEFVLEHWNELERELDRELAAFQKDKEWTSDIVKWIQDFADGAPLPAYEEPDLAHIRQLVAARGGRTLGKHGPTVQDVRRLVEDRLEVDRADGIGEMDYAALFHGGSVIRYGPHATSPSLADRLPLFNRLLALLGSQFYGYGPEAALTPMYQPNILGQCWAFAKDAAENKFGSYAVLSVKLAEPVYVRSISMEHVLSESGRGPKSAIQSFRLFGYVDQDAATDPIALGSFDFAMDYKEGLLRQEFEINDNETIPRLGSVSLVVDSTWGADYACLYRFRVHGGD